MPASLDMSKLSVTEKLRLVAELWDSLDKDAEIELSEDQLAEINRRLSATDADPNSLVSDADMRRRLGWAK
jgi:putative addiction module component (TIGR02574 family)